MRRIRGPGWLLLAAALACASPTRAESEVAPALNAEPPAAAPARKPMGPVRYVVGGLAGTIVGFGSGHVIQGRWRERGWIFTAGESAAILMMISSFPPCFKSIFGGLVPPSEGGVRCGSGESVMLVTGFYVFAGLRILESLEIWITPALRRQQASGKAALEDSSLRLSLFPAPLHDGRLGLTGMLRF